MVRGAEEVVQAGLHFPRLLQRLCGEGVAENVARQTFWRSSGEIRVGQPGLDQRLNALSLDGVLAPGVEFRPSARQAAH